MSTIFISYARTNQRFALFLQEVLETLGYKVWIDVSSIPGGEKWATEIETAIRESQSVAVVVTPAAAQSEAVNHEIDLAIANKKRIIPIMLDGDLPERLSEYQWVDFRMLFTDLAKAFPVRKADAVIDDLQRQLADNNPEVRLKAIPLLEALTGAGRAVPQHLLVDLLNDSSYQVRVEAARALGALKAGWARDQLIARLEDEHKGVRCWVAWALGKIGDPAARQPLLELQKRDSDDEVLHWVQRALDLLPRTE